MPVMARRVDVLSTITSLTKLLGLHPINLPGRDTVRLLLYISSLPFFSHLYIPPSTVDFEGSKGSLLTLRISLFRKTDLMC